MKAAGYITAFSQMLGEMRAACLVVEPYTTRLRSRKAVRLHGPGTSRI